MGPTYLDSALNLTFVLIGVLALTLSLSRDKERKPIFWTSAFVYVTSLVNWLFLKAIIYQAGRPLFGAGIAFADKYDRIFALRDLSVVCLFPSLLSTNVNVTRVKIKLRLAFRRGTVIFGAFVAWRIILIILVSAWITSSVYIGYPDKQNWINPSTYHIHAVQFIYDTTDEQFLVLGDGNVGSMGLGLYGYFSRGYFDTEDIWLKGYFEPLIYSPSYLGMLNAISYVRNFSRALDRPWKNVSIAYLVVSRDWGSVFDNTMKEASQIFETYQILEGGKVYIFRYILRSFFVLDDSSKGSWNIVYGECAPEKSPHRFSNSTIEFLLIPDAAGYAGMQYDVTLNASLDFHNHVAILRGEVSSRPQALQFFLYDAYGKWCGYSIRGDDLLTSSTPWKCELKTSSFDMMSDSPPNLSSVTRIRFVFAFSGQSNQPVKIRIHPILVLNAN